MVNVVVREAALHDAEAAAAVYVASAEHHHSLDPSFYRVPSLDAVASRYRERIPDADDDSVLLVGDLAGQVVGSCFVRLLPEPTVASMLIPRPGAEIDVAVLPGFRGRSIGYELMSHGEDWARDRGAHLLMLNAHAENVDAIRLYTERLSYRRVGVLLSKEIPAGNGS